MQCSTAPEEKSLKTLPAGKPWATVVR